jgi:hypothetical protein
LVRHGLSALMTHSGQADGLQCSRATFMTASSEGPLIEDSKIPQGPIDQPINLTAL